MPYEAIMFLVEDGLVCCERRVYAVEGYWLLLETDIVVIRNVYGYLERRMWLP